MEGEKPTSPEENTAKGLERRTVSERDNIYEITGDKTVTKKELEEDMSGIFDTDKEAA